MPSYKIFFHSEQKVTITARVTKTKTTTIFTPWKTNQNKSDKSTMRLHSGSSERSTFHFRNCLAIYKSAIISSMSKKYYKKYFMLSVEISVLKLIHSIHLTTLWPTTQYYTIMIILYIFRKSFTMGMTRTSISDRLC